MKVHTISLVNSLLLIFIGVWAYVASGMLSITALIPVFIGIPILVLNNGLKKHNRVIAHIVVVLTLLVIIGLVKPLTGAIGRNDFWAVFRVVVMMLSSLLAMVYFVRSFIDARRQ